MFDYFSYAKEIRRELHEFPEIGFDLPKTLAVIRRELDKMDVSYTEKYGKSSIVATINPGKPFTIALRADMDALPIKEETGLEFASKIEGQMHACGHDIHTANLLAAGRKLNDMRNSLNCCVKLLFTPAEEYRVPGCKLMVEDGVTDEFDCAVALHVDTTMNVGQVNIMSGGINANSMGIEVEFFGKGSHANSQQKGIDAIRIAVEAYMGLELMLAREVPSNEPTLLNIGTFHGGSANNIIADYAKITLSSRTQNDELTKFMEKRIKEICEKIAELYGGSAKVTVTKLLPYVDCNPIMTECMRKTAERLLGEENILPRKRTMGGEDFSFISRKKPSVMFRLGVGKNVEKSPAAPLHSPNFLADEDCLKYSIDLFVNFVTDYQNGITF